MKIDREIQCNRRVCISQSQKRNPTIMLIPSSSMPCVSKMNWNEKKRKKSKFLRNFPFIRNERAHNIILPIRQFFNKILTDVFSPSNV